jgi:glycosyltransferase involved in cell wall biosynthesis
MKYFNFNDLIKINIILNLIIFDKKLSISNFHIHPFYSPFRRTILSLDKSKNQTLQDGRNFLDKCLNLSNHQKYNLFENPKVTAIIPLFNCEKTIEQALHSIQYQNISNFEIILVNDFSKDNTYEIIKNIKKDDQRIIIINNHRNMGTLYSRSIASLIANGEYIFSLDNDDLFFYYDVFDYIYKKAKKDDLDIIGFLAINIRNYTADITRMIDLYTYQFPDEFYLEQPELGIWMIKFNNKFLIHNNMIWDKCIKTLIYKKAVNLLGFKRYSKFLSWAEDTSINYVLLKTAKSFKYIYKYGVAHFVGRNTASNTQPIELKIFGELFLLDIIFDFSGNNIEEKNLLIDQALYIYKGYKINRYINNTNSNYLKSILKKIFNCKYTSKLNKRKIKKLFITFFN